MKMIERSMYLKQLVDSKENGFPKVITGIRRCGKSTLLNVLYRNYLNSIGISNERIIFMDLTDTDNARYCDPVYLNEHIIELAKNDGETYFIFLDEIQNVYSIVNPNLTSGEHVLARKSDEHIISFVNTVLSLSKRENIDLYITGSNSRMLSTDIITEFRDKATNIHINPLSFEEFYNFKGGSENDALYEYMRYGGMPIAVLSEADKKRDYLKSLFETTYFRDIIERHNLRRSESLDDLCNILSECTGDLLNTSSLSKEFERVTKGIIDKDTVEDYIGYFKDSFILKEATRYDIKGKCEIGALRKYYYSDTGLRNARLNFAYPDLGKLLENVVFNELLYNGYTVNVGTYEKVEKNENGHNIKKNYEIDFVAKKGIRLYYIQVCEEFSTIETIQREIKPYIRLNDQIQKIVVVNRPIDESRDKNGFIIIGATEFLLRFIK